MLAKGYNQAIKDIKKEVEKIADFEEMTCCAEKIESLEQIIMSFKIGIIDNNETIRRIKQNFQLKH